VAYPSGSGSERIHRGYIHNQANTTTSFRFGGLLPATGTSSYDVPDHHIITMLTITINDQSNAARQVSMWMNNSSSDISILQDFAMQAYQTFTWNDKFVLHPDDKLLIAGSGSSNFDVYYTYIEQNWI
jgi:hypothetical protein